MIPCLMITHNRLEYTKRALEALLKCEGADVFVFDNGSDGFEMTDYLWSLGRKITELSPSWNNHGIAGAFNWFLKETEGCQYVAKVDNDTIVPPDFIPRMLPHMRNVDICQAKHHIIPATNANGWEGFTKDMKREGNTLLHHFIGGSGILCKRDKLTPLPVTANPLQPWRQWQREHPEVKKGFAPDVEITLLDAHGYTDYPEYYKKTGRC